MITALLEGLAVACLISLCAIGALFTRRVAIRRRGGTFDCSLRLTPASETGAAQAAVHFGAEAAHANMNAHAHHSHHESGQQPAGSESEKDPAPAAVSAQQGHTHPDAQPSAGGHLSQHHPNGQTSHAQTSHGHSPHEQDSQEHNSHGHGSPGRNSHGDGSHGRNSHGDDSHGHRPPFRLPHVPHEQRGTRVPFSASGVRAGRGWSYGIAQYENDRIDWYRIFSYAYRPAAVLTRRDLEVLGRRDAEGNEELALFPGWTIVECSFGAGLVELAMSPDALTGFLSWLEAAPPGQNVSRVS